MIALAILGWLILALLAWAIFYVGAGPPDGHT